MLLIGSDGDGLKGDLRRASFGSVSSDVSVEYDVTQSNSFVGQLEFGLDYDRSVDSIHIRYIVE